MKITTLKKQSQHLIQPVHVNFIGLFRTSLDLTDRESFCLNAITHDCLNGSAKGYLKQTGLIAKTYAKWALRCNVSARTMRYILDKFVALGIINKQKLDSSKHRVLKGKYPNNTLVISLNMESFANYGINEAYLRSYLKYDKRKIKLSPHLFTKGKKRKNCQTLIYPLFYRYNNLIVYNTSPMIKRLKYAEKLKILPVEEQLLSSEQLKYGLDMEITRTRLERSFQKMKDWYIRLGYTRINLAKCDGRWKKWLSHEYLPREQKKMQEEKIYQRKEEDKIIQLKDYQPSDNDLTTKLKKLVMEKMPKQLWADYIPVILDVTIPKPGKLCIRMKKYHNCGINGMIKTFAKKLWPEVTYIDIVE